MVISVRERVCPFRAQSDIHFGHVDSAASEGVLFEDELFHEIGPTATIIQNIDKKGGVQQQRGSGF